jgi:hypothetical protein
LFYYLREELKMKNYRHIKKLILIVVMGTFLFQLNIWLHAQSEGEIVRQFQKAKSKYLNGQYVNAKTRIERIISIIIEKDISRGDILGGCYLLLGAIYEKVGKPDLAEENYRKATGDCGIMKVEGVDLESLTLYGKIVKKGIINTRAVDFVTDRNRVEVAEGGTAVFNIKLSAQPGTDVHIVVGRVSGDNDIHIVPGADLTFTTSDWHTFKEVRLQANEDEDTEDGTAVIRISADGIPGKTIKAVEVDNDKLHSFSNNRSTFSIRFIMLLIKSLCSRGRMYWL